MQPVNVDDSLFSLDKWSYRSSGDSGSHPNVCFDPKAAPAGLLRGGGGRIVHAVTVVAEAGEVIPDAASSHSLRQQMAQRINHFAGALGSWRRARRHFSNRPVSAAESRPKAASAAAPQMLSRAPKIHRAASGHRDSWNIQQSFTPSATTASFRSGLRSSQWIPSSSNVDLGPALPDSGRRAVDLTVQTGPLGIDQRHDAARRIPPASLRCLSVRRLSVHAHYDTVEQDTKRNGLHRHVLLFPETAPNCTGTRLHAVSRLRGKPH